MLAQINFQLTHAHAVRQATEPARLNFADCLGDRANMEAYCDDHDYLELPMPETLARHLVEVNRSMENELMTRCFNDLGWVLR